MWTVLAFLNSITMRLISEISFCNKVQRRLIYRRIMQVSVTYSVKAVPQISRIRELFKKYKEKNTRMEKEQGK